MHVFNYNTPIYREILLQFLQFTEKYFTNRTLFNFRCRVEVVLRRAAVFQRRSAQLVLARLKDGFIRRSEPC